MLGVFPFVHHVCRCKRLRASMETQSELFGPAGAMDPIDEAVLHSTVPTKHRVLLHQHSQGPSCMFHLRTCPFLHYVIKRKRPL